MKGTSAPYRNIINLRLGESKRFLSVTYASEIRRKAGDNKMPEMEEYLVYVHCHNLRQMEYCSRKFVRKYVHRIVTVRNNGFYITLGYNEGKRVNVIFELWKYYRQAILGKRNVRSVSAEVAELLDFNYIESAIGLQIDPETYRPSK